MFEYLKLANAVNHDYFVQVAYKIVSELGFDYTYNDIENMSIGSGYMLTFHEKKTKRWHLGIWAVGEWHIKEMFDDDILDGGYGIDTYKPLTISVFVIHDWNYDKMRPTYSDWERLINHKEDFDKHISTLKNILKNPIDSYYDIVLRESYNFHNDNRYIAYFKKWCYNVFSEGIRIKKRRLKGYVATRIFMLKARFDKRVAHREYEFHKDKWNNEYEIAIVFKYGEREWDDWKVWSDYDKLFENLYKWNIWVNFNYLDEDGNLPTNIWRGVYWTEEPEKEK